MGYRNRNLKYEKSLLVLLLAEFVLVFHFTKNYFYCDASVFDQVVQISLNEVGSFLEEGMDKSLNDFVEASSITIDKSVFLINAIQTATITKNHTFYLDAMINTLTDKGQRASLFALKNLERQKDTWNKIERYNLDVLDIHQDDDLGWLAALYLTNFNKYELFQDTNKNNLFLNYSNAEFNNVLLTMKINTLNSGLNLIDCNYLQTDKGQMFTTPYHIGITSERLPVIDDRAYEGMIVLYKPLENGIIDVEIDGKRIDYKNREGATFKILTKEAGYFVHHGVVSRKTNTGKLLQYQFQIAYTVLDRCSN